MRNDFTILNYGPTELTLDVGGNSFRIKAGKPFESINHRPINLPDSITIKNNGVLPPNNAGIYSVFKNRMTHNDRTIIIGQSEFNSHDKKTINDNMTIKNHGPTILRVAYFGVDSIEEEEFSELQPEEDNYSIVLSGESYSLLEIPAESSSAVIAGKEAILENLRLDNLVTGIERASGLVYVAQNGVAGFGSLMAAMTGLGDGIISAAADASLTLNG